MNLQLKGVQGVINALAQLDNQVSREVDAEMQASVNKPPKKKQALIENGEDGYFVPGSS